MSWRARWGDHVRTPQNRNAYCLLLNNVVGAATGLLFWLLFARVLGLSHEEVGIGYAVVAMGTLVGVLAKGGLDTALLRHLPRAGGTEENRLFRFALLLGLVATLGFAAIAAWIGPKVGLDLHGPATAWLLVAGIGGLLVLTWLQDARFLAHGDARPSLKRNLALGAARLALPVPIVLLGLPHAVAWSLLGALAISALLAWMLSRRLLAAPVAAPDSATLPSPASSTLPVPASPTLPIPASPSIPTATPTATPADRVPSPSPRRAFVATSLRNASSSAAEFLPGLLLAPIVLAVAGPAQAAYFGIAWTAAMLLFLASSALSRGTLAEMVRNPAQAPQFLRRGLRQHAILVLPASLLVAAMAPQALAFFGPAYAQEGASTLSLLAASIVLVAPANLYLAVLRARDSPVALAAFPLAMVAMLVILAPMGLHAWGLPGVAFAWMAANLPLALVGAWQLRKLVVDPASPLGSPATPLGAHARPDANPHVGAHASHPGAHAQANAQPDAEGAP